MEDWGQWQEGKGSALMHVSSLWAKLGGITTNTFTPGCLSRLLLIRSFSCLLFVYTKPLEKVCSVAPKGENINTDQLSAWGSTSVENDCSRVKRSDEMCVQMRVTDTYSVYHITLCSLHKCLIE